MSSSNSIPYVCASRPPDVVLQNGGRILLLKDALYNPETGKYHDIKLVKSGWKLFGIDLGGGGKFTGVTQEVAREVQETYGIALKTLKSDPRGAAFWGGAGQTSYVSAPAGSGISFWRRLMPRETSYPLGQKQNDVYLAPEDAARFNAARMTLHDAMSAGIWNAGVLKKTSAPSDAVEKASEGHDGPIPAGLQREKRDPFRERPETALDQAKGKPARRRKAHGETPEETGKTGRKKSKIPNGAPDLEESSSCGKIPGGVRRPNPAYGKNGHPPLYKQTGRTDSGAWDPAFDETGKTVGKKSKMPQGRRHLVKTPHHLKVPGSRGTDPASRSGVSEEMFDETGGTVGKKTKMPQGRRHFVEAPHHLKIPGRRGTNPASRSGVSEEMFDETGGTVGKKTKMPQGRRHLVETPLHSEMPGGLRKMDPASRKSGDPASREQMARADAGVSESPENEGRVGGRKSGSWNEDSFNPSTAEHRLRKQGRFSETHRSASGIRRPVFGPPVGSFPAIPGYKSKSTPIELGFDDAPFDERMRRIIEHLDRSGPVPFSAFVDKNANRRIDPGIYRKMEDGLRRLAADPASSHKDAKYMRRLCEHWMRAAYHYLDQNSEPGDGFSLLLSKAAETIKDPKKAEAKAKELYWRRHGTIFWLTLIDLFASERLGIDRFQESLSSKTSLNPWFQF